MPAATRGGRGLRFRCLAPLVLVLVGLGLVPSSAGAATVFGADLNHNPENFSSNLSITNVIQPGGADDNGAPVSGILTSVRVRTTGFMGGTGVIRVLSLVSHPSATAYTFNNSAPEVPVTMAGDNTPEGHITEVLTRRPIAVGQRLGWQSLTNTTNQLVSYNDPSAECALAFASHPPGEDLAYTTNTCNHNVVLIAGTIEPDADGDGFGDETQDACPNSGQAQHLPCPATVQRKKKKCKKKKKQRSAEVVVAKKKKCKKKRR
jgi:hypothetical protein